jgi:hypothetical protein
MGCQKQIARKIVDNGGCYIFSLKGNRSMIRREVAWWSANGELREVRLDSDRQVDKNHDRLETRQLWCTEQVEWFVDRDQWAGLSSLIAVDGQRRMADGRIEEERRYFVSSLKGGDAKTFARLRRILS